MRSRAILMLLLAAATAHAEEKKDATQLVAELRDTVRDENSGWNARWAAYRKAKAAVDAADIAGVDRLDDFGKRRQRHHGLRRRVHR